MLYRSMITMLAFLAATCAGAPADYAGKPYEGRRQVLPGRLECARFDIGGEGVAYHDTDAINHGSGELNHQAIHCEAGVPPEICYFREKEGVDISYVKKMADLNHPNFHTPDAQQLYIGWEEDGEWVNFTVDVKTPGRYRMVALYSKEPNTLTFDLDGRPAAACKLPMDTGHWHIWNKADCGELALPSAGLHVLTMHYKKGNNLAYFDIVSPSDVASAQLFNLVDAPAGNHGRSPEDNGPPKTIPASAQEVSYEGRSVVTADGSVWLGYPGIVTRLHFRGSVLRMHTRTTSDEVYLDVGVDDATPVFVKAPKGDGDVELARGLAEGEHQVAIFKRVESAVGALSVVSFTVNGDFLAPAPLPERRLMFLGDSFTAGQATTVEDGGSMDRSKAMRQNARLCYGRLLADRLHAQAHILAYAGRGVVRDWKGVTAVRCAPEYYEYALPDEPATQWNPRNYVPDAIGVCLGNNDFDAGVPDEAAYVASYAEFIRKLRRDAPAARIFLIASPSLTDPPGGVPKRTVQRAYLDEIVRRLNDAHVTAVAISNYPGVPGDGHPSGTAHRAVTDELEPVFRKALGW